jgi:hypothetical protein
MVRPAIILAEQRTGIVRLPKAIVSMALGAVAARNAHGCDGTLPMGLTH